MIMQLHYLVSHLGSTRVYVSVFESGSHDQTKTYLALFEMILTSLQVQHTVQLSSDHRPDGVNRIEYLAGVRNQVMQPLYTMQSTGKQFDKVLFLNDVFFCVNDALELLYQSRLQQSDITCALDFDINDEINQLGFYDTWVDRNMKGEMFKKIPLDSFTNDQASDDLLRDEHPFQVQCCWNGMVVLNANAFVGNGNNIKFRREYSSLYQGPLLQQYKDMFKSDLIYSTCSQSEMNQLCDDFIHAGLNKIVVVPAVKVAYDLHTYQELSNLYNNRQSRPSDHSVNYQDLPKAIQCLPLDGDGARSPDGQLGMLLVDPSLQ
ncbi:hypothetical protein MIR68_008642 [Amoeboaphelidium protococcarum]|nr:hypothetical protein MIR68_008642 [Amoeboaphelidium protococcarum]